MGWWDTGIMGGDSPLDALVEYEEALEFRREDNGDAGLYPLTQLANNDILRERVRKMVNARFAYLLIAHDKMVKEWGCDEDVVTQVLATLIMACGAHLPAEFKKAAIAAGENDDWAKEDAERRAKMSSYLEAIRAYETGKPVQLKDHGLFERNVFEL
jgi:hypothetical protein